MAIAFTKKSLFTFEGASDVGLVRTSNEDAIGFFGSWGSGLGGAGRIADNEPLVVVISDGVGGHEGGEVASAAAVAGIGAGLANLDPASEDEDLLERATALMAGVNRQIHQIAGNRGLENGMMATVTAGWFCGNRMLLCHAGDSRAYRWRNGALDRLTIDDTKAGRAEAANPGFAGKQRRKGGEDAHLQRVLGMNPERFKATVSLGELQKGDLYLFCSDGLLAGLSDSQIAKGYGVFTEEGLSALTSRLIETGNRAAGTDNITVGLVHVDEAAEVEKRGHRAIPSKKGKSNMKSWQFGLLTGLLVLLSVSIWRSMENVANELTELSSEVDETSTELGELSKQLDLKTESLRKEFVAANLVSDGNTDILEKVADDLVAIGLSVQRIDETAGLGRSQMIEVGNQIGQIDTKLAAIGAVQNEEKLTTSEFSERLKEVEIQMAAIVELLNSSRLAFEVKGKRIEAQIQSLSDELLRLNERPAPIEPEGTEVPEEKGNENNAGVEDLGESSSGDSVALPEG